MAAASALCVRMTMGTRNPMDFRSIKVRVCVNFYTRGFINRHKILPVRFMGTGCSYSIRTREPMSFLNPIEHSEIVILFCEFITDLTSLPFNSYFSEPLSGGYECCRFAFVVFVYTYGRFVTSYVVMII